MKNRKPVTILGLALLLSASAQAGFEGHAILPSDKFTPPVKQKPFVETAPENNEPESRLPKYIRVNVPGYHVRADADFDVNKSSNVDHKTVKGSLYAVTRIQKMQRGLAVGVSEGGQERWIYVPNWRKNDFQFCESEACFADLAAVLDILSKQGISSTNLAQCGITLNENGEVIDATLPAALEPASLPKPRPAAVLAHLDAQAAPTRPSAPPAARPAPAAPSVSGRPVKPAEKPTAYRPIPAPRPMASRQPEPSREYAPFTPMRRPVWETNTGEIGRRWTGQLSEALDRYGQGLLSRRSLGDAAEWCPNYGSLSSNQRKEFWMHVFPAMARFESGYNPKTNYDEKSGTNPRSGRINPHNHSQGLMQLSYGSTNQRAYRNFCKFDYSRDRNKDLSDPTLTIYDTQKQLDCAVGIMNKWVSQDGRIGGPSNKGGARFWSTNRYSNPKTRKVRELARRYGPCSGR